MALSGRILSPRTLWPLGAALLLALTAHLVLGRESADDAQATRGAPEARFLAATDTVCARLPVPPAPGRRAEPAGLRLFATAALPAVRAREQALADRSAPAGVRNDYAGLVTAHARAAAALEGLSRAPGRRPAELDAALAGLAAHATQMGTPSCGVAR